MSIWTVYEVKNRDGGGIITAYEIRAEDRIYIGTIAVKSIANWIVIEHNKSEK